MKRLLIVSLIFLVLSATASAGAMTLGGPSGLPGKGNFELGLLGTWVGYNDGDNTDLKSTLRNQNQSWTETDRIDRVKIDNDAYLMGTFSYGLLEDLSLTAGLGAANGGTLSLDNADAKLDSVFVWSLGAKYRLMEDKNGMGVIFSARYMRYDNRELSDWRVSGGTPEDRSGYSTDDSADFYQLDAAATLYWKRGCWTPYIGAGLTYWEMSYEGKWNNPANGASIDYDADLNNDNHFIALAGVEVELGKGFNLNFEGVFAGRSDLSLSLSYDF